MSLVLMDNLMRERVALYSRVAISHLAILFAIFAVMRLLPGGPKEWGINVKHWRGSLLLGVVLGLAIGLLFSLFTHGTAIRHWSATDVMIQLNDKQNVIFLLSQIFLIGTSEELFFRGILVTYLMKLYPTKFVGLHLGVIIVSIAFASIHFYKLLFGASLGSILPLVIGGLFYGLVLGWLYQATGSLIGPIVLHNICNTCMLLVNMGIQG